MYYGDSITSLEVAYSTSSTTSSCEPAAPPARSTGTASGSLSDSESLRDAANSARRPGVTVVPGGLLPLAVALLVRDMSEIALRNGVLGQAPCGAVRARKA